MSIPPPETNALVTARIPRDWLQTKNTIINLTDYSLLSNRLVLVQNTYSSFLRTTTEYNFVIESKINKK